MFAVYMYVLIYHVCVRVRVRLRLYVYVCVYNDLSKGITNLLSWPISVITCLAWLLCIGGCTRQGNTLQEIK